MSDLSDEPVGEQMRQLQVERDTFEQVARFHAERVRELEAALEKIAANTECSIGNTVASKHTTFCAYHTAHTALSKRRD